MGNTVNDETDGFDDGRWGTSNIDLVAAPVRYPRSPLVALLALAVLPALALLLVHRWADGEADAYEDSRGATGLFDQELTGSLADTEPTATDPVDEVDESRVHRFVHPRAGDVDVRLSPSTLGGRHGGQC